MWITARAARLAAAALLSLIALGIGATGVAAAATPSSTSSGRTVNLHITVQPTAAAQGASFTDTITVTNVGQDTANNVRISVPFDSSTLQLLGVQFNTPGAWVTSVAANQFQANLGGIGSQGQQVQLIASFAALPGHSLSSALPSSIEYHYSHNGQSHGGTITTELLAPQAAVAGQSVSASVALMAGGTLPISSAIFAPGEAVAFWYNAPDGTVVPLYIRNGQVTTEQQHKEQLADGTTHERNNGEYLNADGQGAIATQLSTNGLEAGAYSVVAHGLSSNATAVVAFAK
jgi:hypothetical protein